MLTKHELRTDKIDHSSALESFTDMIRASERVSVHQASDCQVDDRHGYDSVLWIVKSEIATLTLSGKKKELVGLAPSELQRMTVVNIQDIWCKPSILEHVQTSIVWSERGAFVHIGSAHRRNFKDFDD